MEKGSKNLGICVRWGTVLMLVSSLMFVLPAASAHEMEMELWDSGDLEQNESWSHTFMMETNDMFSCTPHPPNVGFPDFTGWVNVSNDTDASAENVTIYIDGFAYVPRTVKIQPGVTVTFVNNDSAMHTATQMDMGGYGDDEHHADMESGGLPGFPFGLTFAALAAASVAAGRRER